MHTAKLTIKSEKTAFMNKIFYNMRSSSNYSVDILLSHRMHKLLKIFTKVSLILTTEISTSWLSLYLCLKNKINNLNAVRLLIVTDNDY